MNRRDAVEDARKSLEILEDSFDGLVLKAPTDRMKRAYSVR